MSVRDAVRRRVCSRHRDCRSDPSRAPCRPRRSTCFGVRPRASIRRRGRPVDAIRRRAPGSMRSGQLGEVGGALLEVGHDRLDLVGRADQAADHPALLGELLGGVGVGEAVEQRLGAPDGVGAAPGDLGGQRQRVLARASPTTCVASPSSPASRPRHDARRERQLLGDVGPDEPGQEQRAGHVRHQPPVDLAHRQLGVGVDDADVGAEGDLDAAAEGVAVDGGDHRDRQLLPHPRRPAGRGG